MKIAAIDPGLTGGLADVDFTEGYFEWRPMPIVKVAIGAKGKEKRWIDVELIKRFLGHFYDAIVLEQQSPRPMEGSVSSHTSGGNMGMLRTLCMLNLRCPVVVMPHPMTWKKELGVAADKKQATAMCRDIFGKGAPSHDGPAEALLLAYWYWKRKQVYGNRADDGVLVEPRAVRTRQAFLGGYDPSRSGAFSARYTPPDGRTAGRLFRPGAGGDGKKAPAGRRASSKAGARAGDQDAAL